jgi:hypothetical protein
MKVEINKDLYDRFVSWMADYEEPELLEESMPDTPDFRDFLLEEAFEIFYGMYQNVEK